MNKDRIMRKLSERDYIRKLREEIRDGLCFTMKDEYLGKHPAEYEKLPGTNLAYPFLHATVDMLTASLLHTVVGKVVDDVIDAIIKESNEQQEEISQIQLPESKVKEIKEKEKNG